MLIVETFSQFRKFEGEFLEHLDNRARLGCVGFWLLVECWSLFDFDLHDFGLVDFHHLVGQLSLFIKGGCADLQHLTDVPRQSLHPQFVQHCVADLVLARGQVAEAAEQLG